MFSLFSLVISATPQKMFILDTSPNVGVYSGGEI